MALHDPPIDLPFVDLKTGLVTDPWQQWLIITKRDKANRVEGGTEDNVATLDADGHPQDSSSTLAGEDLVGTTDVQELSNKTFSELVSTRILASDGAKGLSEIDLDNWISGTTSQVMVTDDGDGKVTLSIEDLVFIGDKGLCYGSLYLHAGAVNIDISTAGQGVYVKVTGFTAGKLHNVTINSDAFNVGSVGHYKIDWQISADSAGTGKIYEVDIFINDIKQTDGSSRRDFGAAGVLGSMSGTAIIDVTDTSHDIDLRVEEPGSGGGTDLDIFHMNFNIVQIGGT